MLRKTRIALAVIFLVAITVLIVAPRGAVVSWLSWMPAIQFVPALLATHFVIVAVIALVTLLMGRIYCSMICPMGVFQDVINRLRSKVGPKRRRRLRFHYSKPPTALRIAMLVLFVVLIVAGLTSIAALIEPYTAYARMTGTLVSPAFDAANNLLADEAAQRDSTAFVTIARYAPSLLAILVSLATLAVVGLCAWFGGRVYCNSICPVGTVLGFLSRWAWLRPVIDADRCVGCHLCERRCKASCIDAANHKIDYSRCVTCFDCIDNCNHKAISFIHPAKQAVNTDDGQPDATRRAFLTATGAIASVAAVEALASATDSGLAPITPRRAPGRSTPLVPPGAVSSKNFHQHCTACQLCVSKCPERVLRPSLSIDTLLQPVMEYENGYCRPDCNTCSKVCPAGAIKPLRVSKAEIAIGAAVVDASACLSATGAESCGNCARHCPYGAIKMMEADGSSHPRPIVNTSICRGCGACEYVCPVRPVSAIHVEGYDVHHSI